MFCKNCGRQIPDDAAFCPECGTKRSGGDTFGDEKTGRDIKDLPTYAKENELNRSDDVVDTKRQKFSLSGPEKKKFSLSDNDKKFSLSDKKKDSGDGIVRISANSEPAAPPKNPTGFVNPLKDSGKTVFHDEPAGNTPGNGISAKPVTSEPETSAAQAQSAPQAEPLSAVVLEETAGDTGSTGGETGFVNPLKDSGQEIHWGSDGDRNAAKDTEHTGDPTEIDSHLGFAIFTLLCCCQPTSILAIVFAIMVSHEIKKGNYEQAQKYSNVANVLCWVSIVLSIFCGGVSSIANREEWNTIFSTDITSP